MHAHARTHTDILYTPSDTWELLARDGRALWDCVSSNSVKHCAGLYVPELKMTCRRCTCLHQLKSQHTQGSQLRTACEFLIYTNVISLVKMAAFKQKERWRKRVFLTSRLQVRWNDENKLTVGVLQPQLLLWNVKFDEKCIHQCIWWAGLRSPNMLVMKVCGWGMQSVCGSL